MWKEPAELSVVGSAGGRLSAWSLYFQDPEEICVAPTAVLAGGCGSGRQEGLSTRDVPGASVPAVSARRGKHHEHGESQRRAPFSFQARVAGGC